MRRFVRIEQVVVQKFAAQKHGDNTRTRENQHTQGHQNFNGYRAHNPFGLFQAKNQRIQDNGDCKNNPGLKATTGAEVAVKLDIKCKQHNKWDEELAHHAGNTLMPHASSPSRLTRPIRARTPMPAVKITVVSPSVS